MSRNPKKSDPDEPKNISEMSFDEVKNHPAVKEYLRKRIESSDGEVRLGPGGSWSYNESKREDVNAVNRFLHLVADL